MKIDTTKVSYDATWEEYKDGIKVKIRPYPASMGAIAVDNGVIELTNMEQFKIFDHCATAWEGITGSDDNPLPCTNEVKKAIFDFELEPELVRFAISKGLEKRRQREAALGN